MVSIHIVVFIIVATIWFIRLSDRVESQGKELDAIRALLRTCCKSDYYHHLEPGHDE